MGPFLSEIKAFRSFHRIALIDFLSGASFSSKMAHRTAELWTFENSMFDFGSCCQVLGHKTITTGFSSKNHAQRWHWRPKLPTRTDRQCRLEKYSGLSREPFSNRMGGLHSRGVTITMKRCNGKLWSTPPPYVITPSPICHYNV